MKPSIKLDVDRLMTFLPTDYTDMTIENRFKVKSSPIFDVDIDTLLENYNDKDRKTLYNLLFIKIKKHLINCSATEVSRFKKRLNFINLELERLNLNNNETEEETESPLSFSKMQFRTKVILFKELGLLKVLGKNEVFKNNTNLSKLIAELISGSNDDISKTHESIRTDLSYIEMKNHKKTPYTKPQINKVNAILASFSLPKIK